MTRQLIIVFMFFLAVACSTEGNELAVEKVKGFGETNEIPVYDFKALEKLLYTDSDTLYVVNFWAMWCGPCVKELPYFIEFAKNNKDKKVEVLYVSLDFIKDIESKVKPFLSGLNLSSRVVLLDEADANSWIDKVSPNWSGSIPFTIVFDRDKRMFYERDFESLKELEVEINKEFKIK